MKKPRTGNKSQHEAVSGTLSPGANRPSVCLNLPCLPCTSLRVGSVIFVEWA
jgi:hypothetical protein